MAETISARDANQRFSRMLAEVRAGKEYVITLGGKPVARIGPERDEAAAPRKLSPEQEQALADSRAWATTHTMPEDAEPAGPIDRDWIYQERVTRIR